MEGVVLDSWEGLVYNGAQQNEAEGENWVHFEKNGVYFEENEGGSLGFVEGN